MSGYQREGPTGSVESPETPGTAAAEGVPGSMAPWLRGAWDADAIAASEELRGELARFALLIAYSPPEEEATLLREALVIVASWARLADPDGWGESEQRIQRFIDCGAGESAAVAMLPHRASYVCSASPDGFISAQVIFQDGPRSGTVAGATMPLALTAALFRVLALNVEHRLARTN